MVSCSISSASVCAGGTFRHIDAFSDAGAREQHGKVWQWGSDVHSCAIAASTESRRRLQPTLISPVPPELPAAFSFCPAGTLLRRGADRVDFLGVAVCWVVTSRLTWAAQRSNTARACRSRALPGYTYPQHRPRCD